MYFSVDFLESYFSFLKEAWWISESNLFQSTISSFNQQSVSFYSNNFFLWYWFSISSSEILLDDLSQSIDEDRMIKLRAICVLDEELLHLQEDFSLKSLNEQIAIRLHQIRAMINIFFKQTSSFSNEDDNSTLIPLIHLCDSFLTTFRLFLNDTSSDISLNSSNWFEINHFGHRPIYRNNKIFYT